MRLSIWPGSENPWHEIVETALHAERTGWDGLYLADHFMSNTEDGSRTLTPRLEGWTTLAAIAGRVGEIRLGVLVSGNTYRRPAVLANMAATLDHISGGRLVLGLGAGWQENEHEAYGIELPPPRQRLDRFEEACEVVTKLLHDERADFAGSYYQLVDAVCEPKAEPGGLGIPLLVGGAGEKRTMLVAARLADQWNTWGRPDRIAAKTEVLERHCATVGRDPATIERSAQVFFHLSDDPTRHEELRQQQGSMPAAVGSAPELADVVGGYREIGLDELIVPDRTLGRTLSERLDIMDRLKNEVFSPALA